MKVKLPEISNLMDSEYKLPVLLLFNVILFSSLFFYDYTKKEKFGRRLIIGNVIFKTNTVQRKFDSQVVWQTIDTNSPISNRDTIRSEDHADAIIVLEDKTEIQIDENSMFFLEVSGKTTNIDFSSGMMKIKKTGNSKSSISLTSGSNQIDIKDGDVKLEGGNSDLLSVYVERGTAEITGKEGKKEIKPSEKLSLDKDGKFNLDFIGVKGISPEDQAKMNIPSDMGKVLFSWKKMKDYDFYILEVSLLRNFASIEKKIQTEKTQAELVLPNGSYYWRVTGVNQATGKKDRSEPNKITTFRELDVKLVYPSNGLTVSASKPVRFAWEKSSLVKGYKLQIFRDSSMKDKFKELEASSTTVMVDGLVPSKYYWRVATIPAIQSMPAKFSSLFYFFTTQEGKEITKEEILKAKEEEKSILSDQYEDLKNFQLLSPVDTEVDIMKDKKIKFSWKFPKSKPKYKLKLFHNGVQGKKLVFQKDVSSTNFVLDDMTVLDEGSFHWTLSGELTSQKGKLHEKSGKFSIVLKSKIKKLKPEDIRFTSPKIIYKEGENEKVE